MHLGDRAFLATIVKIGGVDLVGVTKWIWFAESREYEAVIKVSLRRGGTLNLRLVLLYSTYLPLPNVLTEHA